MNVIIVGSGAVAAEITSYIESNNKFTSDGGQFNLLGYLDFAENVDKYWAKYKLKKPVIADVYGYEPKTDDNFIAGISDIGFRKKMIGVLREKQANIVGFVHHSVIVDESAVIGAGNIVYPHCIIGPNTVIGDDNLITSYSFVSHDCAVGNNNFFATAGLSGRVRIGDDNFFGIRSTVLPHVSIGSRNTIQAGMIVDKDVTNDSTVFYRFKEKVIAIQKSQNAE